MDNNLPNNFDIEKIMNQIDALMEQIIGDKPDPETLFIMSKYLNMNPIADIDVKSLFQSIKRDNKIKDILGE